MSGFRRVFPRDSSVVTLLPSHRGPPANPTYPRRSPSYDLISGRFSVVFPHFGPFSCEAAAVLLGEAAAVLLEAKSSSNGTKK